jgi:hypothetical protein
MKNHDVALVVPSIREASLKRFIDEWRAENLFNLVDLVIVEDNPKCTFQTPPEAVAHFDWSDIDDRLGKDSWIIPRRSDTVRSFGYWWAWANGYKTVTTLDDDVYPCKNSDGKSFVDGHLSSLHDHPRWMSTIDGRPRGLPYGCHGTLNVMINHGLWTNVADLDAPTQLSGGKLDVVHDFSSRVVPRNVYFPMCGMNVAWKHDATVLMYHLLQGRYTVNEELILLPFDRMGDIWCGVMAKKACDHLGWSVSTGTPYVYHDRASNVFANLAKEANGIVAHEDFWKHIDETKIFFSHDVNDVYATIARHVANFVPSDKLVAERSGDYFKKLSEAMLIWTNLFR